MRSTSQLIETLLLFKKGFIAAKVFGVTGSLAAFNQLGSCRFLSNW